MKKLLLILFTLPMFSQVGIGTTNPETTLHIADNDTLVFGLRIEKVPDTLFSKMLIIDSVGNVGKRNIPINGQRDFYQHIADECVIVPINEQPQTVSNIDLGHSLNITIPPNTEAFVEVIYDIPISILLAKTIVDAAMGINFYRNGILLPEHDRKVNSDVRHEHPPFVTTAYQNYNINHSYFEEVSNTTSTPITITYEIRGWFEQFFVGPNSVSYVFNKWCDGPAIRANPVMGSGSITAIVEY